MLFCKDGMLWDPIDGTRGRKNQMPHPYGTHRLQQGQGTRNVIGVILERVLHRFPHVGKPRKVQHICNMVLLEHLDEPGRIVQVSLYEVPLSYGLAMAIDKVVVDHRPIATL